MANKMAKYKVWARLEGTFDDIEADSEEEAFQIASDALIDGGSWDYKVKRIEDENNAYCHQLFKMISQGLIEMEDGKIKMEGNMLGDTKVGFVSLKDDEGE